MRGAGANLRTRQLLNDATLGLLGATIAQVPGRVERCLPGILGATSAQIPGIP